MVSAGHPIFFVDFDGTITERDTSLVMVETCAEKGWQAINEKWERGELTTLETAEKTFQLFNCSWEEIVETLKNVKIDSYFKEFVEKTYCKGYQVYILSDGYDLLIEEILEREKLNFLPYYANQLIYTSEGRFSMQAPYFNSECEKCGVCKSKLMQAITKKSEPSDNIQASKQTSKDTGLNANHESTKIYIGDGTSDSCAIEYADLVFAKKKLYRIARNKQIEAVPINSFFDVIAYLEL